MAEPSEYDSAAEHFRDNVSFGERENFCERLEKYIESNPFRAMGMALVAGIAVAKLLL